MTRLLFFLLALSVLFTLSGCFESSSSGSGSTPDLSAKEPPASGSTPNSGGSTSTPEATKDTSTIPPNNGKPGCLTLGKHFLVTNLTGKEFCADKPIFSEKDDSITFTDNTNVEAGQKKEIRILRPNNKAANSLLSSNGELLIDYVYNKDTNKYQGNKLCFKTTDLNADLGKYGISIDTVAKTFTFNEVKLQEMHDHACSIRTNNKDTNSTLFLNGTLSYE